MIIVLLQCAMRSTTPNVAHFVHGIRTPNHSCDCPHRLAAKSTGSKPNAAKPDVVCVLHATAIELLPGAPARYIQNGVTGRSANGLNVPNTATSRQTRTQRHE